MESDNREVWATQDQVERTGTRCERFAEGGKGERFEITSLDQFLEFVYEQGWTDGLPVFSLSREAVLRMIDYVGRDPGEVLSSVYPGYGEEAAIENIAIND